VQEYPESVWCIVQSAVRTSQVGGSSLFAGECPHGSKSEARQRLIDTAVRYPPAQLLASVGDAVAQLGGAGPRKRPEDGPLWRAGRRRAHAGSWHSRCRLLHGRDDRAGRLPRCSSSSSSIAGACALHEYPRSPDSSQTWRETYGVARVRPDTFGERPDGARPGEVWETGVRHVARYRAQYDIIDPSDASSIQATRSDHRPSSVISSVIGSEPARRSSPAIAGLATAWRRSLM
jgi:hypothetical protein